MANIFDGATSVKVNGVECNQLKINDTIIWQKPTPSAGFRHPQIGDYIEGKKLYFGVWGGGQWTSRGFPTITTSDVSTMSSYWLQTSVTSGFQLRTYRLSSYIELRAYKNTSYTSLYRLNSSTSSIVTNLEEFDISTIE